MRLREIEDRVMKQDKDMLMTEKQEDIDRKVLELLVKYIKNQVNVELYEDDIIKISNMYYRVFRQYNLNFLKQIIKYSNSDIDMYKVLSKLEIM